MFGERGVIRRSNPYILLAHMKLLVIDRSSIGQIFFKPIFEGCPE